MPAEEEAPVEEEAPAEVDPMTIEVGDTIYAFQAEVGDWVTFDLVLGGEAVAAVIFSDNGSVEFPHTEYTESMTLRGKVINDEVNWGIVFLSEDGDLLSTVRLGE